MLDLLNRGQCLEILQSVERVSLNEFHFRGVFIGSDLQTLHRFPFVGRISYEAGHA